MGVDYYKILAVDRGAPVEVIRFAFKALALKYHPDRNKDPGAEERFKEVQRAYDILGDPDKRRGSDATLDTASRTAAPTSYAAPGRFWLEPDLIDFGILHDAVAVRTVAVRQTPGAASGVISFDFPDECFWDVTADAPDDLDVVVRLHFEASGERAGGVGAIEMVATINIGSLKLPLTIRALLSRTAANSATSRSPSGAGPGVPSYDTAAAGSGSGAAGSPSVAGPSVRTWRRGRSRRWALLVASMVTGVALLIVIFANIGGSVSPATGGNPSAPTQSAIPTPTATVPPRSPLVAAQFRPLNWSAVHLTPAQMLGGVSCPSASFCVAVDQDGSVLTSTDPSGGSSAWTESAVTSGALNSVSCPTTGLCVAVGGGGTNGDDIFASTNPMGGSAAWSNAISLDGAVWISIACPTSALCVAVGGGQIAVSSDPGSIDPKWAVILIANFPATSNVTFTAVSCPTTTLCVAVGYGPLNNVLTSTNPTGGASAWTYEALDGDAIFSSISCFTTELCIASEDAGWSGNSFVSSNPTGGPAGWTRLPAGNAVESSMSCPNDLLCLAPNEDGTGVIALVDSSAGAAAWTVEPIGDGDSVAGMSCVGSSLCVAVNSAGGVFIGS